MGDLYSLEPKFMLDSGHDWTVSQPQLFMNAKNGNFTVAPYASTWRMELHSTKDCGVTPVVGYECYWVEVWWNGILQSFDDMCAAPTRCTWSEFRNTLLPSRGFVETTSDYEDECKVILSDSTKTEEPVISRR
jgi:hypothetical protein